MFSAEGFGQTVSGLGDRANGLGLRGSGKRSRAQGFGLKFVLCPLQEALGKKLQLDRLYGPLAISLSSTPCEDRVLDGPASGAKDGSTSGEVLDGPASGDFLDGPASGEILDGPASGAARPQTPRAPASLLQTGLFTREGPWDWVASSTEEPIPPPVE